MGSCEHVIELSDCMKGRKFLYQLNVYHFSRKSLLFGVSYPKRRRIIMTNVENMLYPNF